ncbi:DUF6644 family protein [Methylosinus sp. LW4]|uniref:DUF6644 family protein n=1 Tax=Methylosinus sp. LW4 TaxID=136993 RepID=UPI00036FB963|nr:DUF6644 family protein [Methylosinus sp. LW4]
MTVLEFLRWLQDTGVGIALRKSDHLVGAGFQLVHIFGFILLLASVTFVDLRLLGLALAKQAPVRVIGAANILLATGLSAAIVSGVLIFLSGPVRYYSNEFFQIKMLSLVVAVLFQASVFRAISKKVEQRPLAGKAVAIVSLLLWFGVGVMGRIIGFV